MRRVIVSCLLAAGLSLPAGFAGAIEVNPTGGDDAAAINAAYAAGHRSVQLNSDAAYCLKSRVNVPTYAVLEGRSRYATTLMKCANGDMVKLGTASVLRNLYLDGLSKGYGGGGIVIEAPDYYQAIDHVAANTAGSALRFVGPCAGQSSHIRDFSGHTTTPQTWVIVLPDTDLPAGAAVTCGNRTFRDIDLGVGYGLYLGGAANTVVDQLRGGIYLGAPGGPSPNRVVLTNSRTGNPGGGAAYSTLEVWASYAILGPGNAFWDVGINIWGIYNEVIGRNGPAAGYYNGGGETNLCVGCVFAWSPFVGEPPPPPPPPVPATVSASPTTMAAGGTVTATWAEIPTPTTTDWIGLYVPGSAEMAYIVWIYTSCTHNATTSAATGSCPFKLPAGLAAGAYELRLYGSNGYVRMATSGTLTVP